MKIRSISPERKDCKVRCCQCGKWIETIASECFVDLDGIPFVDYYCAYCVSRPEEEDLEDGGEGN